MHILPYEKTPAQFKPWTHDYLLVAEQLIKTIRTADLDVLHFGSTSMMIGGKGIIDVSVLYQPGNRAGALERLRALGFQDQISDTPFPPERPRKDGAVIVKGKKYYVHAHVIEQGSDNHQQQLQYTQYMLAKPSARAAYEALKKDILSEGIVDQEAYGKRKSPFVKWILNEEACASKQRN